MREWVWAEWRQARVPMAALAGLHLALLVFATRVTPLPQLAAPALALLGGVYLAGGLLLGAWQLRRHRSPHAWMSLLHRPVAGHQIGLQLAACAALQLLAVVVLPLCLALVLMQAMGQGPQGQHLGLVAVAWGLALAGWLAAAAALLAPWPRSVALWLLPVPLLLLAVPVPWLMLLVAVACAWLLGIWLGRVQPDWTRAPRGTAMLLLEWLPQALIWAWLLRTALQLAAQAVLGLLGQHPAVQPASPSHFEHWRSLQPAAQLSQALPMGVPGWTARDLAAARHERLMFPALRLPTRWMAGRAPQTDWRDAERGWRAQFDHDALRYRVRDERGRALGWLGRGCLVAERSATPPFEAGPPLKAGAGLLDGQTLWRLHPQRPCLEPQLSLPPSAGLLQDALHDGDAILTVSTLGVQRWRAGAPALGPAGWQRQWSWAWPVPIAEVQNLLISVHPQGQAWLLSVLKGRHLLPSDPSVTVHQVDAAGQAQLLAQHALQRDYADWFLWADLLVSPTLAALADSAEKSLAGVSGGAHLQRAAPPLSAWMQGLVAASAALAVALASLLAYRRTRHGPAVAWAAGAALLLGWAALPLLIAYPPRFPPPS